MRLILYPGVGLRERRIRKNVERAHRQRAGRFLRRLRETVSLMQCGHVY